MLEVMIYASNIFFWACAINYLMLSSMNGMDTLLFFITVLIVGWIPPNGFLSSIVLILIAIVLLISAESDAEDDTDDDIIEIIFVQRLNHELDIRRRRFLPTLLLRQHFSQHDRSNIRFSLTNNNCIQRQNRFDNEAQSRT